MLETDFVDDPASAYPRLIQALRDVFARLPEGLQSGNSELATRWCWHVKHDGHYYRLRAALVLEALPHSACTVRLAGAALPLCAGKSPEEALAKLPAAVARAWAWAHATPHPDEHAPDYRFLCDNIEQVL